MLRAEFSVLHVVSRGEMFRAVHHLTERHRCNPQCFLAVVALQRSLHQREPAAGISQIQSRRLEDPVWLPAWVTYSLLQLDLINHITGASSVITGQLSRLCLSFLTPGRTVRTGLTAGEAAERNGQKSNGADWSGMQVCHNEERMRCVCVCVCVCVWHAASYVTQWKRAFCKALKCVHTSYLTYWDASGDS